jgi:hypothetical protein
MQKRWYTDIQVLHCFYRWKNLQQQLAQETKVRLLSRGSQIFTIHYQKAASKCSIHEKNNFAMIYQTGI